MEFSTYFSRNYKAFQEYKERMKGNIYLNCPDTLQILLKEYSRLRTKEMFNMWYKGYKLPAKPKKVETLIELMQGLDDWEYDGTVDTGYMGGGMCTLGHSLRYIHYARSASTGAELQFGSTCVSDFFGITPAVIRRIDDCRKDVADEVSFVLYVYENDKSTDFRDNLYGDLAEMCSSDIAKDKFKSVLGAYSKLTNSMLAYGYPLPNSLVYRVNKFRLWYRDEYSKILRENEIRSRLESMSPELAEHYDKILSRAAYGMELNKYIRTNNNAKLSEDVMVGCVSISKEIEDNKDRVEKFHRITDSRVFYVKNKRYVVSNGVEKRLATKYEVDEKCLQVTDESQLLLSAKETNVALASLKYCCVNTESLDDIVDGKSKDYLITIYNNRVAISRAVKFLNKHLDEYEDRINKLNKHMEYGVATSSIPEIKPDYSFADVVYYVEDNIRDDASPIVKNIMSNLKYKSGDTVNSKLSLKQGQVIRKYFNSLMTGQSDSENRIASNIKSEYTSNNKRISKVVYMANKEKDMYAVCLMDSMNKIVYTTACSDGEHDNLDANFNLANVYKAVTYISNRDDAMNLGNMFEIENVVITGFGKELTERVGSKSSWAKFAEIEKFVDIDKDEYNKIIRATSKPGNVNNSKYYLMKTAVMLALAYRKYEEV